MQVRYLKSKKAKNTVLAQSRKAGKKLGYRAVVKLTVAAKATAKAKKCLTSPRDGPKGPVASVRPGPSHARLESTAGPIAQLVEQGTFNPKVAGSSPARPTRKRPAQ